MSYAKEYTVKCTDCGTEHTIRVSDPGKKRYFLKLECDGGAFGLCDDCEAKEAEKYFAPIRAALTAAGAPDELKGTEKQAAWAKRIRTSFYKRLESALEEHLKEFSAMREQAAEDKKALYEEIAEDYKRAFAAILLNPEAKYWIDNRDNSPRRMIMEADELVRGETA